MLLLEEKSENSHVCYFESSNIPVCKYRRDLKKLAIIFKDGRQYVFENITPYTFQRFKVAGSQGKEFATLIKNQFNYTKVDGLVEMNQIYEIIDELKKNNQ